MAVQEIKPFSFSDDEEVITDLKPLDTTQEAKVETYSTEKKESTPDKPADVIPTEDTSLEVDDDTELPNILEILAKNQEKPSKEETVSEVSVDHKAMAKYLIDEKVWDDLEGFDELEITPEIFAELTKAQAVQQINKAEQDFWDAQDEATKQLNQYVKAGGKIDNLLESIKEQRDIESIPLDTVEGQEEIVRAYYESLDWDKKKIDKAISRSKDDDELESEAKEYQKKLLEVVNEDRAEMLREQEAIAKDRQLKAANFNKSLRTAIHSDKDLVDRDKKDLEKFYFEFKYEDNQGKKFTEFDKNILEIQSDPKRYQKLLKMIKNFDAYEDKAKTEKTVTSKVITFAKSNAETLSNIGSGELPKKESKEVYKPFKFK